MANDAFFQIGEGDELDGGQNGRYPWWELREPGDKLTIAGRGMNTKAIQMGASAYGRRHGMRLVTRCGKAPSGEPYVIIFFQCRREEA